VLIQWILDGKAARRLYKFNILWCFFRNILDGYLNEGNDDCGWRYGSLDISSTFWLAIMIPLLGLGAQCNNIFRMDRIRKGRTNIPTLSSKLSLHQI